MILRRSIQASVLIGLGLTASVESAVVEFSLMLRTADGSAEIPKFGPYYMVEPYQEFQVVLLAEVHSPNLTDNLRSPENNGIPLGLAIVTVDLVANFRSAVPKAAPGFVWSDLVDLTPDGLAYPFSPLRDINLDSYLDVTGVGFASLGTHLPTDANASIRSRFQYGTSGPIPIVAGNFFMVDGPWESITTIVRSAVVYADNPNSETLLSVEDVTTTAIPGEALINWPEPASMLVGASFVGFLAIRRRRLPA